MNAMMMRYRADGMFATKEPALIGADRPQHPGTPSVASRAIKQLAAGLESARETLAGMSAGPSHLDHPWP